jgi:hypothetical protein
MYGASVFIWMLICFHIYVASVFIWMLFSFAMFFKCFCKCSSRMFQVFHLFFMLQVLYLNVFESRLSVAHEMRMGKEGGTSGPRTAMFDVAAPHGCETQA